MKLNIKVYFKSKLISDFQKLKKSSGKFLGQHKRPTDLPFFYAQKSEREEGDDVKIFYVWFRTTGA